MARQGNRSDKVLFRSMAILLLPVMGLAVAAILFPDNPVSYWAIFLWTLVYALGMVAHLVSRVDLTEGEILLVRSEDTEVIVGPRVIYLWPLRQRWRLTSGRLLFMLQLITESADGMEVRRGILIAATPKSMSALANLATWGSYGSDPLQPSVREVVEREFTLKDGARPGDEIGQPSPDMAVKAAAQAALEEMGLCDVRIETLVALVTH
ncbi:MAG: hypothetical protein DCC75_03530 [Proteobacteria bacterium]|nr:MAG: hypothetical protein DCC75_03530 [Pseudomonadota bacterium]